MIWVTLLPSPAIGPAPAFSAARLLRQAADLRPHDLALMNEPAPNSAPREEVRMPPRNLPNRPARYIDDELRQRALRAVRSALLDDSTAS
jgi:hypothetical protein